MDENPGNSMTDGEVPASDVVRRVARRFWASLSGFVQTTRSARSARPVQCSTATTAALPMAEPAFADANGSLCNSAVCRKEKLEAVLRILGMLLLTWVGETAGMKLSGLGREQWGA